MTKTKSCQPLAFALETLRLRVEEAKEALRAITRGQVDTLMAGPKGGRVFRLKSPDSLYYHLVEQMHEGACILNPQGTILFANSYLACLSGVQLEQLIGSTWSHSVRAKDQSRICRLVQRPLECSVKTGIGLVSAIGETVPIQLSLSLLPTKEEKRLPLWSLICANASRRRRPWTARRMSWSDE